MPKATPLVLISILAVTAISLSVRSKVAPPSAPPALVTNPQVPATPAVTTPAPPAKPPTAVTTIAPRPWPHAGSDIAPDAAAAFGHLANGFRYVIYPNHEPPKRVSLRLHIASGSLMEADDQRGLAHFLEHMVFNGTKHFTAEDLVPRMQRLGIAFGAHVNAFTSFDETVYMLDLPDLAPDTLQLAFTVLRDFGDGALLTTAEIDRERGVILAEKISRDTVNYRLMERQFNRILPDLLISKRFPIGLEEVIKTAPRERFVDLYSRYYTPQRMTLVVVGDIEPAAMHQQIESSFGTMSQAAQNAANPDPGPIHQPEGLVTTVFSDKEVAATDVSLTLVRPHQDKPDSVATRGELLPLDIAHAIIDRRFERISKEKNSPVAEGSAVHQVLFNTIELGSISITAAADRWQEVVPILEQEFRRALNHGFTAAELAEAKSNLLNTYEQAVKHKATRKSENIATELAKSINNQEVFADPETELAIAKRNLETIDSAACHAAFKTFWDAPGYHLILTTKDQPDNAEQNLAALFEDSRGTPVETPAARATQVFDYSHFGKTGHIANRKQISDLGITQLVLSNKVCINLKRTDFERGAIRLLARIGAGKLTQPKDMPMLDIFAAAVFEGGGLGKHSNDDLKQIFAGKNVSSVLAIGEDSFTLSGATTPADFTLQCQLMCATLTDPGYREDALWQFRKEVPMLYQKLNHTPAGPQRQMDAWLHGGDSRFSVAPAEKLTSYTLKDARSWLTPELTKGYLELTIVGDFELKKILPDLLATFGALPVRTAGAPVMKTARHVQFPAAPASKVLTYQSKIAQGVALALWQTVGVRNHQPEFRRLNLLADILGDRLREEIREKLGASYSPNADAAGSDALDNMGYIISESIGKPSDIELLLNTMRELANTLATKGATADELDRARKPMLGQLAKSLRDNNYWLGTVMSKCQADPQRLDLARTRDADYNSITLQEINALATKYLKADNVRLVTITPKE